MNVCVNGVCGNGRSRYLICRRCWSRWQIDKNLLLHGRDGVGNTGIVFTL